MLPVMRSRLRPALLRAAMTFGAGACADAVFAERFIADVKLTVFDRPVMAVEFQRTGRVGLARRRLVTL